MRFAWKILWLGFGIGLFVFGVGGCVSTPSLRMPTVLGPSVATTLTPSRPLGRWPKHRTLGLMTLSDATGPEAAPPISSSMLSRLSKRIQVYLERHCAASEVKVIPINKLQVNHGLPSFLNEAKESGVESLMIVVFSSTETTEPATFGEARMMTQMPGTTTHNSALVELGLIDVAQGIVGIQVNSEATESLDRLRVPIGHDQPPLGEALDILRANAAQQALDAALSDFTRSCGVV